MDRDSSDIKDRYQGRMDDDQQDSSNTDDGYDSKFPDMGVTESVKKEWPAVNMYLPGPLRDAIDAYYRDLRYESGDELQKGRHYYPLIARLGFERISEMNTSEVKERLETWEREDGVYRKEHTENSDRVEGGEEGD